MSDLEKDGKLPCLAPGGAEPVRGPRLAVAVHQDLGAAFRRAIEHGLERCAGLETHTRAGFRLLQSNPMAVISRPRQAQQIALALSGPSRSFGIIALV